MISSWAYTAANMKPGSLWTLRTVCRPGLRMKAYPGRWSWKESGDEHVLKHFDFFLFKNESEADPYGTGYNDALQRLGPNCNALMYLSSIKKMRQSSRSNNRLPGAEARWHKFLHADKILYGFQEPLDKWLIPFGEDGS